LSLTAEPPRFACSGAMAQHAPPHSPTAKKSCNASNVVIIRFAIRIAVIRADVNVGRKWSAEERESGGVGEWEIRKSDLCLSPTLPLPRSPAPSFLPRDLAHLAPRRQLDAELLDQRLDFGVGKRLEVGVTLFPRPRRRFQLRVIHSQVHDQHGHAGLQAS